jgi:tetratricopeptide (TPR) repeat protein
MARHPSDYLIAGLTAQAYLRARDPRAVDLMNRALALNPKHPGLHVLAARMLLAGGLRAQALIEFSLALAHTLEPDIILADLLRFFPDPEEAARGIPTPAGRVSVMTNRLTTMRRPDVALAYARRASEENPNNHEILQTISQLALERGEVALAVRAGEAAYGVRRSAENALAYARALRASGGLERARAVIEEVLDAGLAVESWRLVRLHELLADIQAAQGEHRAARDALRTAISLAGGDAGGNARGNDRHLAGLYTKLARIEQALGHTDLAREAQQRAREHGAR